MLFRVDFLFEIRALDDFLGRCDDPCIKNLIICLKIVDWICQLDFIDPRHCFFRITWTRTYLSFEIRLRITERRLRGEFFKPQNTKTAPLDPHLVRKNLIHQWWQIYVRQHSGKSRLSDGRNWCHVQVSSFTQRVSPCPAGLPDAAKAMIADIAAACGAAVDTAWMLVSSFLKRGQENWSKSVRPKCRG